MVRLRTIGGVALAAMLCLSGCANGAPADNASESLVIYSGEEVMQDFADRYTAEHPNVEIKVVAGSSGELNARVAAEKANPQGDINDSGTEPSRTNPELYLKTEGVVDLSAIDKRFIVNEYATTIMVYPLIFAYNVDQLKGDTAPATWAELADPKWKGRLYMGNPTTSEAAYKAVVTLHSLGGWDLVRKVAANAVITESSTDPMRALGNSEAAIGIGVENQVYKWADGKKVVAVYPKDGMIVHVGTSYLIKGGPNTKGAAAFLQWVLTPEVQNWMASEYPGTRSSLADAAAPTNAPAMSGLKILEFPQEAREKRAEYVEKWKDIITSL
jgi:iron(III) transport system substrate-binding protein